MSLTQIQAIYRQAGHCRHCFGHCPIYKAPVDIAQPRWVGPDYFKSSPRVLIVAINPGSVDQPNELKKLLRKHRNKSASWGDVMLQLSEDGHFQRKYLPRYIDDLQLNLDDTAFMNIALCAAKTFVKDKEVDAYPTSMLEFCFARYSRQLITAFEPDICLLSGSLVHRFQPRIAQCIPNATLVRIAHYARGSFTESVASTREAIRKWKAKKSRKARRAACAQ